MNGKLKQGTESDGSHESGSQRMQALISEFERKFPTEQDCLTELFRLARISDKLCRFCSHSELQKCHGRRAGKCRSCNRITWFTAGTWLHHVKKAKARLAAIYLAEKGEYLSTLAFSRAFKISQSSAFVIMRWLSLVVENLMPANETRIHSSLFAPVFCKRSKETPAGCHPFSEQERAEQEEMRCDNRESYEENPELKSFTNFSAETKKSPDSDDSYNPSAIAVTVLLSESPVGFDELCQKLNLTAAHLSTTLVLLELDGSVSRLAGDRYVRAKTNSSVQSVSPCDKACIDSFFEFIRSRFHGISRKYLQGYLALYWCRSVLRFRARGEFMQGCLQSTPVNDFRNYVTPLLVQIADAWKQPS